MKLSLAEAALGAVAVLEAPEAIPHAGKLFAQGYSIDSRTVDPGELFFAIRGEHFDGHDFVATAISRGALAAVVERSRIVSLPNAALAAPLLVVDDTLLALQNLAATVRRQWSGKLIAVTGSAGKTTTKDAIATALATTFSVHKSHGNLNNGFGLPLQLLKLEPEHQFAVIEMGMNHIGEIRSLCRIAAPDWGVITNIGTAHIENFPDGQAGIARAKFELIESLPPNGTAFLNADDAYACQFGRDFHGRVFYFGANPTAHLQATAISETEAGIHVDFRCAEQSGSFTLNLPGLHNASNALAALSVAIEALIPAATAARALETLTPGDKRGQTIHHNGVTILNDCYNSNPEALKSMIRSLASHTRNSRTPAANGRRILIAGEMLEMGSHAPALHAECGHAAATANIDLIVGVRGNAEFIVSAAQAAGANALFLADAEAAGHWMQANLRTNDIALVKGSRGVRLERAIEIFTGTAPTTNH
jgi:UDP-N-acetylmuramoyl-tripeptide--D-alanyl-D-alanine ligase